MLGYTNGFQSMFNQSLVNVDQSTIRSLTVLDEVDLTGTQLEWNHYDDVTIGYSENKLHLHEGAVTNQFVGDSAGIDVTKIGDGLVTTDSFNYLSGLDQAVGSTAQVEFAGLNINGDVEIEGNLGVTGYVGITGDLDLYGNLGIIGNGSILGNSIITGNQEIAGDIIIGNDATIEGNLTIEGSIGYSGDLSVGGNLTVGATSQLTDVQISGDLSATGNVELDTTINVGGDIIPYIPGGGTIEVNLGSLFNPFSSLRVNDSFHQSIETDSMTSNTMEVNSLQAKVISHPDGILLGSLLSPATNRTYSLGTTGSQFLNVYAEQIHTDRIVNSNLPEIYLDSPLITQRIAPKNDGNYNIGSTDVPYNETYSRYFYATHAVHTQQLFPSSIVCEDQPLDIYTPRQIVRNTDNSQSELWLHHNTGLTSTSQLRMTRGNGFYMTELKQEDDNSTYLRVYGGTDSGFEIWTGGEVTPSGDSDTPPTIISTPGPAMIVGSDRNVDFIRNVKIHLGLDVTGNISGFIQRPTAAYSLRCRHEGSGYNLSSGSDHIINVPAIEFSSSTYNNLTGTYTCGWDGIYALSLYGRWEGNSSGSRWLGFDIDGHTRFGEMTAAPGGNTCFKSASYTGYFAAGTEIKVKCFQNSGTTLNLNTVFFEINMLSRDT